jgi:outer membrane lipoprotein-sorting protein
MSGPQYDQSDDLVTQAVAATRQLPLPTGPSSAIVSQTLAALREATSQPKTTFLQRIHQMPWTSKTISVLATAASLLVVYLGLSSLTGSALAFADVVEALNKVRSATWKTVTEVEGPDKKTVTWTGIGMFLAPSHDRTETTAQGAKSIQIMDGQKDKVVTLVPAAKMAMVFDLKNLPPKMDSPFGKTFQGLRALVAMAQDDRAGKVEQLGAETIDGRRAEGFRIQRGAVEVKIWADPKTLLPVRVEQTSISGPKVHIVMTDFQVDVDLDESLFSLEIPKDYTVQQTSQLDLAKKPIAYLAETLKLVAEENNSVFPPTLRGEEGIDGIMQRAAKRDAENVGKDTATVLKRVSDLAMKLGGTFGFLYSLSPENDWHYAGKDVKLNTPNRPIFWYRRNKSSTTYYVLYADLSVKEVPSEQAPKVPQFEGSPKP